jgi:hypothetical protein
MLSSTRSPNATSTPAGVSTSSSAEPGEPVPASRTVAQVRGTPAAGPRPVLS